MDIELLIKKLSTGGKLTEEEKEFINNMPLMDIGLIFAENYINSNEGVTYKGNLILKHKIEDFKVYLSNNTKIEPLYYLKTEAKEYKGQFNDIVKQLFNEGEIPDKTDGIELLKMLKFNNDDAFFIRNDGGYLNLEDLPTEKPANFKFSKELQTFINALDEQQAYTMKTLILLGFANIIRKEAIKSRGLLKAELLYGAKYSGKTLITNLVRNMFDEEIINLDEGGTPTSSTALRNKLANNIGIVLCDECDAKMVNKKRRTFYNDIEAIIKGVYQKQLPQTSDLNNQGYLLNQEQQGVPVFTMNDKINITEALKDRVIAIEFNKSEELPIIDINKIKTEIITFGKIIACTFKEMWENTLYYIDDNETFINTLLLKVQDENPSINIHKLIYCTNNHEASTEEISDCIHKYLIKKLEYYIQGNDVDTAFFSNWVKIPWIAKVTTDNVYIHQKKFNDFVKSYECLNDGGISSIRISERLIKETNIKPVKKMVTINNKSFGCIIYSYNEFFECFNLNTN